MRWLEEDGHVSVFRSPSGHSNGNTFDHEGRQLSCEHGGRRVARYEHSGAVTVIAERYDGRPLNSPNDVVVHPDRSIWFTDPPYGIRGNYEGHRAESELPVAVYRVDPQSGQVARVTDEIGGPNGLCFSPDYSRLYVADTGSGREIKAWDVDGDRLRNGRRHVQLVVPGDPDARAVADGVRCRRGRQHLDRRRAGGAGHHPRRGRHRRHPAAGALRQRLLRRDAAEPPLHDRQPVAVLGLRRHARRRHRLTAAQAATPA